MPATTRVSRGTLLQQLLPIDGDERIATVLPVSEFADDVYLLLLTKHGWIKKTPLKAFARITARGLIAVSLSPQTEARAADALVKASLCTATDSAILCSAGGQACRFDTSEAEPPHARRAPPPLPVPSAPSVAPLRGRHRVRRRSEAGLRASGRQSRGVKSMSMRVGDTIADMFVVSTEAADADSLADLVAVTRYGFGKRMRVGLFRTQKRGGNGQSHAHRVRRPRCVPCPVRA